MREALRTQERLAFPSTMTVQAPQWPFSQPFFAPTRPSSSRRKRSRDSEGSTSLTIPTPFTVRLRATDSDKEPYFFLRELTNRMKSLMFFTTILSGKSSSRRWLAKCPMRV